MDTFSTQSGACRSGIFPSLRRKRNIIQIPKRNHSFNPPEEKKQELPVTYYPLTFKQKKDIQNQEKKDLEQNFSEHNVFSLNQLNNTEELNLDQNFNTENDDNQKQNVKYDSDKAGNFSLDQFSNNEQIKLERNIINEKSFQEEENENQNLTNSKNCSFLEITENQHNEDNFISSSPIQIPNSDPELNNFSKSFSAENNLNFIFDDQNDPKLNYDIQVSPVPNYDTQVSQELNYDTQVSPVPKYDTQVSQELNYDTQVSPELNYDTQDYPTPNFIFQNPSSPLQFSLNLESFTARSPNFVLQNSEFSQTKTYFPNSPSPSDNFIISISPNNPLSPSQTSPSKTNFLTPITLSKLKIKRNQNIINRFHEIISESNENTFKNEKEKLKDGQISVTENGITCVFYEKLNLIELHSTILEFLNEQNTQKIFELEEQRNLYLEKTNKRQTIIQRKSSLQQLEEIDKQIDFMRINKQTFLEKTKPMLDEYEQKFSEHSMFDSHYKNESIETKKYRHYVIDQYLFEAAKYVRLIVERKIIAQNLCSSCGYDIQNVQEDINGYKTCPECFVEQENICNQTYQDEERGNIFISKDNNHQDKMGFLAVLYQYQGIEKFTIPIDLFSKLDCYFISINGVTSKKAQSIPTQENGTKLGTSRSMMMTALEKTRFRNLYKNCRLICKIYWGWSLPNISHLIEPLLEDYTLSENIFQKIKDPSDPRKSCLNAQFRAWKLLNRRGHKCSYSDFKGIDTDDILRYHEQKWTAICEELGWDSGHSII